MRSTACGSPSLLHGVEQHRRVHRQLDVAADPQRDGCGFRWFRMTSLVMITVTEPGDATVLAPLYRPVGLGVYTNLGLHYIVPWATFLGFFTARPAATVQPPRGVHDARDPGRVAGLHPAVAACPAARPRPRPPRWASRKLWYPHLFVDERPQPADPRGRRPRRLCGCGGQHRGDRAARPGVRIPVPGPRPLAQQGTTGDASAPITSSTPPAAPHRRSGRSCGSSAWARACRGWTRSCRPPPSPRTRGLGMTSTVWPNPSPVWPTQPSRVRDTQPVGAPLRALVQRARTLQPRLLGGGLEQLPGTQGGPHALACPAASRRSSHPAGPSDGEGVVLRLQLTRTPMAGSRSGAPLASRSTPSRSASGPGRMAYDRSVTTWSKGAGPYSWATTSPSSSVIVLV